MTDSALIHPSAAERPPLAAWLPITEFRRFHRDPNINYQLNRFLIPGTEGLFEEIGARIENFDDWKVEFLSAAALAERRDELARAASLYRAAEFFMSPSDPARLRAFEKFISLFYRTHQDRRLERLSVPYGSGHLYGLILAPESPPRGTIVVHAGYDAYVEEFYGLAQAMASRGYQVEVVGVCREQSVGKLDRFKGRITVFPGRTDDREVIGRAVEGCDGVLTVLAPWGVHDYASGTAQAVLDLAQPDARLIFSWAGTSRRMVATSIRAA